MAEDEWLTNEEGDLLGWAEKALKDVFERFDEDKDGFLNEAELNLFAIACNGESFPKESIQEIQQYYECNKEGHLSKEGFLQMYFMQSAANPSETLKDFKTLGIDIEKKRKARENESSLETEKITEQSSKKPLRGSIPIREPAQNVSNKKVKSIDTANPFYEDFRKYSAEYDDYQTRRESLIKISRDVTSSSKKVIFLLHRIATAAEPEQILDQAQKDLEAINQKIGEIVLIIEGQDYWKYARAFTPGLEEYIEAVTFYYFLKDLRVIPLDEVNHQLRSSLPHSTDFTIKLDSYLGGIADLTGEIMRYCINKVASGSSELSIMLLTVVRSIFDGFQTLNLDHSYSTKLNVMETSMKKLENVCYNLHLRGAEYPMDKLLDILESEANAEGTE